MAINIEYDQNRLILLVRGELDELMLLNKEAATDAGMQDTASSRFSDYHISRNMGQAARNIAARVGAEHLPLLVDANNPSYTPESQPPFLRMLIRSATMAGIFARRRVFATLVNMVRRRSLISGTNPIVIYEDGEFRTEGGDVNAGGSADVVLVPLDVTGSSNRFTLIAGSELVFVEHNSVQESAVGSTIAFSKATGEVVHYSTIKAVPVPSVGKVTIDDVPDVSVTVQDTPNAAVFILSGARFIPSKLEEALIQYTVGTLLVASPLASLSSPVFEAYDRALRPYAVAMASTRQGGA